MPYTTYDEMLLRYGKTKLQQLTDREQPLLGEPVVSVIEDAIQAAAELIDGYAAAKYRVPLSPVPAPVRVWCQDIAFYRLHSSLGSVPEDVRLAFEDAIAALKDMARGLIAFQVEGKPSENAPGGGVQLESPGRIFGPQSLKGF